MSMSTASGSSSGSCPAAAGSLPISPLRLGVVPYLNVQPLIWAFSLPGFTPPGGVELSPLPPSQLALALRQGRFDAAIVPVFEYFRHPGYSIVPEFAIGCRGPVHSVVLFSRSPLREIEAIYLDPASVTSVNLLRVLLAEHGLAPVLHPAQTLPGPLSELPPRSACLLIGDPAMVRRGALPFEYDLGSLWFDHTGLPFVFAAWLAPPGPRTAEVSDLLRKGARAGLAALEEVARTTAPVFGFSPEAALHYFRASIHYRLGPDEVGGLEEFGRLCARHGLIAFPPPPLRFCPED